LPAIALVMAGCHATGPASKPQTGIVNIAADDPTLAAMAMDIKDHTEQTAGRDINNFDKWALRLVVGGFVAFVIVNRVVRWRRNGRPRPT
jgi:hypothetical protein